MTTDCSQIKTGGGKMVFSDMGKGRVTFFFWLHGRNIMHATATTYSEVLGLDWGQKLHTEGHHFCCLYGLRCENILQFNNVCVCHFGMGKH